MDRNSNRPLTPEEAKERLRSATGEFGVGPWVRRHPFSSVLVGASLGYLLSSLSTGNRTLSLRQLLSLLETILRLAPLGGGHSGRDA